ncbi:MULTISPECIES: 5-carboxymethyl-2-hydroxymuconate Delta-isomerase [unclassified Shewanella]|uniref:5-carboxymethyl-2-hydroxymuconate Delta-isomerase n=1 Tax=unclassified Shewanella TaxID=196818 RepID=UPI00059EE3BD|nr:MULTISPECIES: 5-carboxymethyl-2-hydroxymuconate Delta-isomerase [unclassified Shewanella]KIO34999.1 5-carboxymethyl-2-hydroxymuconate isomerase [Shewanella sp. cp20]MCG9721515.1 5-carboxymethyl-2-hydroxymuconate Delta-isomerase [Shewanella sp. Isolate7]
MPHCILEYSAPVAQQLAIDTLVALVHRGAIESELFEPASIKSRAYCAEHYRVGEAEGADFIHITLKIMPGRTGEQKQHLMQCVDRQIASLCASVSSITMEVLDIEREHYFKRLND